MMRIAYIIIVIIMFYHHIHAEWIMTGIIQPEGQFDGHYTLLSTSLPHGRPILQPTVCVCVRV